MYYCALNIIKALKIMPTISIDIRNKYSSQFEEQLINAVYIACKQALKLPDYDRDIRLNIHEPHLFLCPPNLTKPECFTLIQINCFAGRTIETKRILYQSIVKNLSTLDIPDDHIKILIRELPTENWGIRGGQAACDVNLGFDIHI